MNCLRLMPAFSAVALPIRVPSPAAGNMTATFMRLRFYRGFLCGDVGHGLRIVLAQRPVVAFRYGGGVRALVILAENHLPGRSLQHTGYRDIDGLGDHALGVIDHYHRAIVQVGDALVVLLPFLEDKHAHRLARQYDRLQGVGQFVDVQHLHAMQLRHLIEVEIVGDDLAVVDLGEFDQLHVDLARLGEILLDDLDVEVGHFLNTLQDVQAAAPAIALHRIGGIRDELQLPQDELWDHQHSIQKSGLRDVGDPPVDNDAGVQNLE